MNRLIMFPGGNPLKNDDFDFLQQSSLDCFKAILSAFARNNAGYYILSGCGITVTANPQTDTYTIDEGYVSYDREPIYCPAQTVTVPTGNTLEAVIETTYVPSGDKVYANGITRQTHAVRTLKVIDSANGGTGQPFPFQNIATAIEQLAFNQYQKTDITSSFTLLNSWGTNNPSSYQVVLQKEGSVKTLKIQTLRTSNNYQTIFPLWEEIGVLPPPARPKQYVQTVVGIKGNPSDPHTLHKITISPDGKISIEKMNDTTNNAPVFLDLDITYF